ncbi:MAG: 4Fe-4S ferredoxin [Deltaproteobacteria bacterium]|nr:4Fe-4S ferredoxin [Deltaproteobacteria bacterium]
MDNQIMEVDIACVGFGPAMGGFLTTLSRAVADEFGETLLPSAVMPGMPMQIVCYERADDIGFGVSGVVTQARAIRESFPDLKPEEIPLAAPVRQEKVYYLLDPIGASRRSSGLKIADRLLKLGKRLLPVRDDAYELPYIPPFLHKKDGMIMSVGQFAQWVGGQLMGTGLVQIWPGTPVAEPLFEGDRVIGVKLADQGVEKDGTPGPNFLPGMHIHAALTVVGDGPVGAVGQFLDRRFGFPEGNQQREWAVGMKAVVELPESCTLPTGSVLHTIGYPEPEIFGFFYVLPNRMASLGIFVPSWFDSPCRTSYRYLQHWMMHPAIWQHIEGGRLVSWGAKTLQESGKRGEPFLVGDGYARIGEGSGCTNVLTGSGVDEAWLSGVQLAEGVIELAKAGQPFNRANLERVYVQRRRESWLEKEARIAKKARDGFQRGFIPGVIGMGLTGFSRGHLHIPAQIRRPREQIRSLEAFCANRVSPEELVTLREEARAKGVPVFDAVMDRLGWPKIPCDGKLLVSHQDVLLMGGKVQAAAGFADHVAFLDPTLCRDCYPQLCAEICSGQAITPGEGGGPPQFDRDKCVHCGACLWNCTRGRLDDPERGNIDFRAGSGGLHSAEN